ncbi:MAG: RecQ family ATP-dependent DNA helicase [Dehalococcoidia bacterium]
MLGQGASFREGQWEAISEVVERRARVLVVQRTGWGKSLVYFIATRLLRQSGAGPTLLISPLLSLMRNQIAMAERIGVRALSINSDNATAWNEVERALANDACDILLVSPERLANIRFLNQTLPTTRRGIGLFVVDKAHCISDWGHDFRPDYRRIVRILRALPPTTPVLATTATANSRVAADVAEQLGPGLKVFRGPLARGSLRIQVLSLGGQAQRLAWLAQYLPLLPGSGIIYCLTVVDCERVSEWLAQQGIHAPAYHSRTSVRREDLELQLLRNEVKALVATVALGMGFDKPDLGFVVHFQRPGSLVAYYQQIGRAGRALDNAYAILLCGQEDDAIQDYFVRTAMPPTAQLENVLTTIEASSGMNRTALLRKVNISAGRLDQCLKLLEVDGAIVRDGGAWFRTMNPWQFDEPRAAAVTGARRQELAEMQAFVQSTGCLMQAIARGLDDPFAAPCGHCAVCAGPILDVALDPRLVGQAIAFLRGAMVDITPRLQWVPDPATGMTRPISAGEQNLTGKALCMYRDGGWGALVAENKYRDGHFSDALVDAAAALIRDRWRPSPAPTWVTAVPSLRRPDLVPDLARRLARRLGLTFRMALDKTHETPEQKSLLNSVQQAANVAAAIDVLQHQVLSGPVLLIDDVCDSRWTLTVCGARLRQAGSGPVFPFVLASATGAGDV